MIKSRHLIEIQDSTLATFLRNHKYNENKLASLVDLINTSPGQVIKNLNEQQEIDRILFLTNLGNLLLIHHFMIKYALHKTLKSQDQVPFK